MDLKGEYINMFHEGLVPILLSVGVNLRGQELLLVAWNCVFKPDFIFHTHLYNEGVYCSSTSDCFWGILNVHILLVKYIERGVWPGVQRDTELESVSQPGMVWTVSWMLSRDTLNFFAKQNWQEKYFEILDKNIYCILHLAVGHQLLLLPEGSVFFLLLPRSQHHRSVLVRPSALNTTLTILLS